MRKEEETQLDTEIDISEEAFKKAQKDRTEEQQKVAIPLAIEILQFLVSISDLEKGIGIKSPQSKDDFWVTIGEKFIISLRRNYPNIKLTDLGYAFKCSLEAIEQLRLMSDGLMQEKESYVVNKFFGIEYQYELDLRTLEEKEAVYRLEDYENYLKSKETKKVIKSPLKERIMKLTYRLIGRKDK